MWFYHFYSTNIMFLILYILFFLLKCICYMVFVLFTNVYKYLWESLLLFIYNSRNNCSLWFERLLPTFKPNRVQLHLILSDKTLWYCKTGESKTVIGISIFCFRWLLLLSIEYALHFGSNNFYKFLHPTFIEINYTTKN